MTSPEHQQKMEEMGLTLRYLGPQDYATHWDQMETSVQQLMKNLEIK